MSRNKQIRFTENRENPLVVEPELPSQTSEAPRWHTDFFDKVQPLIVELGCGAGEYTMGLSALFKSRNFVGVDIKGPRFWRNAKIALAEERGNVGFLRTKIQNLEQFFEPESVAEIWITFPDPRPKISDERRRLTAPRFLDIYKKLLIKGGLIHLKTDCLPLFDYSLEKVKEAGFSEILYTTNLYSAEYFELQQEHYGIQTKYEKMFMDKGFKINYLRCKYDPS